MFSLGERSYHGITKDWITNEIFRRADAKERTMDEFMREEVHPLLGEGIHIALNDDELHKCYNYRFHSTWKILNHIRSAPQRERACPVALSEFPAFFKEWAWFQHEFDKTAPNQQRKA